MNVKILSKHAILPKVAYDSDAGYDLSSVENTIIEPLSRKMISIGLALEIPKGYYGRIAPRSGLAYKHGIDVFAGVIDPSYRGEIKVILYNSGKDEFEVKVGDRIAQLILTPYSMRDLHVVEKLGDTSRGGGGFGSSG